MEKSLKKKYELLRKKHRLPSFDELDSEFEIGKIDDGTFLLRELRRKVADKIGEAGAIVEEVLQPDANLAGLYESRVFDEAEKKALFEIFKKLMTYNRMAMELSIKNSEKEDAEFIKSIHTEWKALSPQLLKFIRQLRESWGKESEEAEKLRYMG